VTTYVNSVQQVAITIPTGSTSATATISAVGSLAYVDYKGANTNTTLNHANVNYPRVALTNSTTVTATRNASSVTDAVTVYASVVDATSSLVDSVQSGTSTIGVGSSTKSTTITSVTTSRSAVLLLGATSDPATNDQTLAWASFILSSATTVQAKRNATGGNDTTAGFQVVQFASGALHAIQTVSRTITSGTSRTDTLTAVVMASTWLAFNGVTTNDLDTLDIEATKFALTSTTAVTDTNNTALVVSNQQLRYTVIEYVSGVLNSMQRGTVTMTAATSANVTVTSVGTTVSVVNYCNYTTTETVSLANAWPGISLTTATNIQAVKNSSTSNTTVSYELMEYGTGGATPTGTLVVTQAKDVLAASGKETLTGTLAITQALDVFAASGKFPAIGTLSITAEKDVLAASGKETITGTLAVTAALDSMAASGKFPAIGSLAVTAAKDVLASTGKLTFTGAVSITQAKDVLNASGLETIIGTLSCIAEKDTLSAVGAETITASLSAISAVDVFFGVGFETFSGTLSVTQAIDIFAASGLEIIIGALSSVAGKDIFSAIGAENISGSLSATCALDIFTAIGREMFVGALAVTQSKDAMSATGAEIFIGALITTQNKDTFSGAGEVPHVIQITASDSINIILISGVNIRKAEPSKWFGRPALYDLGHEGLGLYDYAINARADYDDLLAFPAQYDYTIEGQALYDTIHERTSVII
jgi:hypothetical protein